jgi:hypothetical protein
MPSDSKIIYRIDIPIPHRKNKPNSNNSVYFGYGKNYPVLIGVTDYGYTPVKIGIEQDFALERAYDFDIPFNNNRYGFQTIYGDPIYFKEESDGSLSYTFRHYYSSVLRGQESNYSENYGEFLPPHQVRILKEITKIYEEKNETEKL